MCEHEWRDLGRRGGSRELVCIRCWTFDVHPFPETDALPLQREEAVGERGRQVYEYALACNGESWGGM